MHTRFVVGFVVAIALAGCSSAPAPQEPVTSPDVITDPTQGLNDTGAHIHDYWRGQDRLVVIGDDAAGDERGLGPGFSSGSEVAVRWFLPSSGHVVPQGTAKVEVAFSWTDASDGLDQYSAPVVYVKTAGQNASQRLGDTTNGGVLVLNTTLADADLPHQLLSAWSFELRMSPAPETGILRFKGEVTVHVEAVRGLDLPLFPAHPDPWQGASEIALVEAQGQLSYWEDTGDGGSNGMSGPIVFTPASGTIVPSSAAHVVVEVSWSGPVALQLWYHDATSRQMQTPDNAFLSGSQATGMTAHYELPVTEGPDGPYATQSQWEFTVLPQAVGPLRTAWFQDYTITAKAVKA